MKELKFCHHLLILMLFQTQINTIKLNEAFTLTLLFFFEDGYTGIGTCRLW